MKRVMVIAAMFLVFLLGTSPQVSAQLAANEVYVGQSFQLAMDHDGVNATGYRLYRNGVLVATVSTTARVSGVVTFPPRTETAAATVTYEGSAINSDGTTTLESSKASLSVVVKLQLITPNAPTQPRIIRLPS